MNPFESTGRVEIVVDFAVKGEQFLVKLKKEINDLSAKNNQLTQDEVNLLKEKKREFGDFARVFNAYTRAANEQAKATLALKSAASSVDFIRGVPADLQSSATNVVNAFWGPGATLAYELQKRMSGMSPRSFERAYKQMQSERDTLDRLGGGYAVPSQQARLQAHAQREVYNQEIIARSSPTAFGPAYPRSMLTTQGNPVYAGVSFGPGGLGRVGAGISTTDADYARAKMINEQLKTQAVERLEQINNQLKIEGQELTLRFSAIGSQKRGIGGAIVANSFGYLPGFGDFPAIPGVKANEYISGISHSRATPQAQVTEATARRLAIQQSTLQRFIARVDDMDTDHVALNKVYTDALSHLYLKGKRVGGSGGDLELAAMSQSVVGYREPGYQSYGSDRIAESIMSSRNMNVRIRQATEQIFSQRADSGLARMSAQDAVKAGRLAEFYLFHNVASAGELRKQSFEGYREGNNPSDAPATVTARLKAQILSMAGVIPSTGSQRAVDTIMRRVASRTWIPESGDRISGSSLMPDFEKADQAARHIEELGRQRNLAEAQKEIEAFKSRGATRLLGSGRPIEEVMADNRKRLRNRRSGGEAGFISGDLMFGKSFFGADSFVGDSFFGVPWKSIGGSISGIGSAATSAFDSMSDKVSDTARRLAMGPAGIRAQEKINRTSQKLMDNIANVESATAERIERIDAVASELILKRSTERDPKKIDRFTRQIDRLSVRKVLAETTGQRAGERAQASYDYFTGGAGNIPPSSLSRARYDVGPTADEIIKGVPSRGFGFGSIFAIGLAEKAASEATGVFFSATKYAARTQEMELVTRNMSAAAGLSGVAVQQTVQAVQRNYITAQEANKTIQRLMFSQIDLAKAPGLARMAQDVSVIRGIDPAEALDRITQGITSGYTRTLHMMGIMVNSQDIMRTEKTRLGRAPNEYERRQAIADKVLSEGAKVAGNFEASLLTASRQASLLNIQAQDTMNVVGDKFIPVYSNLIEHASEVLRMSKASPQMAQFVGAGTAGLAAGLGFLGAGATAGLMATGFGLTLPIAPVAIGAAAIGAGTFAYLNRDPVGLTVGNIESRFEDIDRRRGESMGARLEASRILGGRFALPSTVSRGPVTISRELEEASLVETRVLRAGAEELAKRVKEGSQTRVVTYPGTGMMVTVPRYGPDSEFNVGGRMISKAWLDQINSRRSIESALVTLDPTQQSINQYKFAGQQLTQQQEDAARYAAMQLEKRLDVFASKEMRLAAKGAFVDPLGQMSSQFDERMEELSMVEVPTGETGADGRPITSPVSVMDLLKKIPGGYAKAKKAQSMREASFAAIQRAHITAKVIQTSQSIGLSQMGLSILPGDYAGEQGLIGAQYAARVANIGPYLDSFGSLMSPGGRRLQSEQMSAEARMERDRQNASFDEQQLHGLRSDYSRGRQLAGGVALAQLGEEPLSEQEKITRTYQIRLQIAKDIGRLASEETQRELELAAYVDKTNSEFAVRAAIRQHDFSLQSAGTLGAIGLDTRRQIGMSSLNSPLLRELQSIQDVRTSYAGQQRQDFSQYLIDSRNPAIGPDQAGKNLESANLHSRTAYDANLFNAQIQSVQSLRGRLAEMYTMRFSAEAKLRDLEADGARSQSATLEKNYQETLRLIEKKRLMRGETKEANDEAVRERYDAVMSYRGSQLSQKNTDRADVGAVAGEIFQASRSKGGVKAYASQQLEKFETKIVSNVAEMLFGGLPGILGGLIPGQSDPKTGKKTGIGQILKDTVLGERGSQRDLSKEIAAATRDSVTIEQQMEQTLLNILAALTGGYLTGNAGSHVSPGYFDILRGMQSMSSTPASVFSSSASGYAPAGLGFQIPNWSSTFGVSQNPVSFSLGSGDPDLMGPMSLGQQQAAGTPDILTDYQNQEFRGGGSSRSSSGNLTAFMRGMGRPSQIWEAAGIGKDASWSSPNGLSPAEVMGSVAGSIGVVAAGIHEIANDKKKVGARATVGVIGDSAAMAAALDPEPISKAVLTGVAMAAKAVGFFMGDPRQERADLIKQVLGTNRYVAPVSINRSMDLNGMATDFDMRGGMRSSNFRAMSAAPSEPYHYQSPIDNNWYVIGGRDPGAFNKRQPTGPYPTDPPASPGIPVSPTIVHQTNHFNLMDGSSILDRKDLFAEATRQAMLNGHQINETASRILGRL